MPKIFYISKGEKTMAIERRNINCVQALRKVLSPFEKRLADSTDNEKYMTWAETDNLFPRLDGAWGPTQYYSNDYGTYEVHFGATKQCFVGDKVVVKRIARDYKARFGNQIDAEVQAWRGLCRTKYSVFLCPVLKSLTIRGKVDPNSKKAVNYSIEIMQKAEFIGSWRDSIRYAEEKNGFRMDTIITDWSKDYEVLKDMLGLHDLHDENCGVIYDYSTGWYLPVIVDYAL